MENQSSVQSENTSAAPRVGFPGSAKKRKSPAKAILVLVVVLLLGLAAAYAYFTMVGGDKTISVGGNITPTISILPTNTPTPTSSLTKDKSELTVQILNGTGITGEAGSLQKVLEKLDYTEIEVGNADKTDYVATEVFFSDKVSIADRDELKAELSKIYQTVKVTDVSSPTFDIKIIIGYKKGVSATPSARPSATPTTRPTGSVSPTVTTTGSITPTKTPTPSPTGQQL